MNRISAILFVLLFSCMTMARIIHSPNYFYTNQSSLSVTDVELTDSATVLTFVAQGASGSNIIIGEGCHLIDKKGKAYHALSTDGITLGEALWFDRQDNYKFRISFQPVNEEVRSFDFVDSEIHRNSIRILGLSLDGNVNASDYPRQSVKRMFGCSNAYGDGETVIRGKIIGYDKRSDYQSLFLCPQSLADDDADRPIASAHIQQDGTFVVRASIGTPSLYFLASMQGDDSWLFPVYVHPADEILITVDLKLSRITSYKSKCTKPHLAAMQMFGVLGTEFCTVEDDNSDDYLFATVESPASKGKLIIETMTRKHHGMYVEFVGLSARTMSSTLNKLSNIRYDFYQNPNLKIVYLFDGKDVTRNHYDKVVARYLEGEDTHLLSAEEFASVREYMLSREPSLVATLNREGRLLVNPLDYTNEFEFRKRFRMLLKGEVDAHLTDENLQTLDTIIEVPDVESIYYDREMPSGVSGTVIPQHQAIAEHKMLKTTWWIMLLMFFLIIGLLVFIVYRVKVKAKDNYQHLADSLSTNAKTDEMQADDLKRPQIADTLWDNLIAAWAAKKPKNASLLAKLDGNCPDLSKRERAMCMILYSENLSDDKVMELLEIPSSSAYRTAKSRLRKKLKCVDIPEIQDMNI